MIGRLTHTFREDYLNEDNVRRTSCELARHADEITEEAKRSMQEEAKVFNRRTKNLVDKKNQLLRESHRECEITLKAVQSRMKEALDGYGGAYDRALSEHRRIVTESEHRHGRRSEAGDVDGSKRPC